MIQKKWPRLAISLLLAALFSWLFLRQARFEELGPALAGIDLVWVGGALSALAIGYSCRIERWRAMMMRDNPGLTWRVCAGPFLGSFAVNNVLPFRAGDLVRSLAFKEQLGASAGAVLATLFVERLLDLLTLLLFLFAMLATFRVGSSAVADIGSGVLLGGLVAVVILLSFPQIVRRLLQVSGRVALRISPRYGRRIVSEMERGMATLEHLACGVQMIRLMGWSLLAWAAEGCVFWCAAQALPSLAIPAAAWLAFPIGSLAVLIPAAPGEVGTFHYFTGRAVIEVGNSAPAGVVYALFVHALLWVVTTFIGGACLYFAVKRERELKRLKTETFETDALQGSAALGASRSTEAK